MANHFIKLAMCMSFFYCVKNLFSNKALKFILVNEIDPREMTCFLHQVTNFCSCSIVTEDHSYGQSWGQLTERNLLAKLVFDLNTFWFLYMLQLVEVHGRNHQLTFLSILLFFVCIFLFLFNLLLLSLFIFFFLRSQLFGLRLFFRLLLWSILSLI